MVTNLILAHLTIFDLGALLAALSAGVGLGILLAPILRRRVKAR